ncbi:hypothetical protein [Streptomyces sp. PanSC19]|uniref:hypothetical protein n=1 Tax=Streptomyces sp. PanSC19 TaxID=1520455 RepID=UPI000F4AF0B8|nr:hypothetical protein [Streptomyces sp. PanSC19]
MTERRTLGPGPETADRVVAAEADLHESIPGSRFPNLDELRGRGLFQPRSAPTPSSRRTLGADGRAPSGSDASD